jgi:hypothetical protein
MPPAEKLLLETLAGHFAWLEEAHPRKAVSPVAKRAREAVLLRLRGNEPKPQVRLAKAA